MSSKSKSDKSDIPKNQSKQKRSFLPRLPSFRKKKSALPVSSSLDKTPSPKFTKEEPVLGRTHEGGNVMRRSKTSELVASFEKRLSDLEDESNVTTKLDNSKVGRPAKTVKTPTSGTSKFSRFGFKGIAANRISSFENRNNNGNREKSKETPEEINANSSLTHVHKPVTLSNRNCDNRRHQTDITRSGSTSSAKSPDSECSSPGSLTTCKVLGLPMPYRSVFSDEPRGLKRQASSQSVDPISSGISTASTSSTPSPCLETMLAIERGDLPSQKAMLNSTFSLSEPRGLHTTYSKEPSDVFQTTVTKDDSCRSGFTKGVLTYKTKDIKQALISSSSSEPATPASQQENELNLVKEAPISQSECKPLHLAAPAKTGPVTRPVTGSLGVSSGQDSVHRQHGESDSTNSTQSDHNKVEPSVCESVSASQADKSVDTMGSTQSAIDPSAISTPARPLHLSLVKPHLSAIRHASESFDSAELDSLGSDDLMCDSRYLEDEPFDQLDESVRLSRSCGMEPGTHRCHNGFGNRNRTSSLDQVSGPTTIDKR